MTEAARFTVIVNPTSGGGNGVRMPAEVRRELDARGVTYELQITRTPGHAVELARTAASAHCAVVVAAGGDGTVHEVANGLLQVLARDASCPTVLGLLPVGTGNDFVKVVPGTRERPQAYDTLVHGRIRHLDAGYATWQGGSEYFVNAAGTGIDVEVVRKLGSRRGRGAVPYILALLRALRSYKALPLLLQADGTRLEQRVMTVAVANGECIGGAFRICPEAVPDDGWFDVCVVEELSLLGSLRTSFAILRSKHQGSQGVRMFRSARVELSVAGNSRLFFQLDGELREPAVAKVLSLELRPGMLPVLST